MLLDFPQQLIKRLDLQKAVKAEVDRPRSMFPSRVVEAVLAEHVADYAAVVESRLLAGLEVQEQESVWAPKPGPVGRYRWLTALPIRDRVVLRACVLDLGDDGPIPDRAPEAFDAFVQAPLQEPYEYITVADVAAFYFFIDHQLLETRIVDASSHADTAEALRVILGAIANRPYGLPQNFAPSDALAELFISWAERRLIRSGVPTYRHNDDFRIGADSWGAGLQALERLGSELSTIGLELNGEKSWILTRAKYESNLHIADDIFDEAVPDDFPRFDPYTGDPFDVEEEGTDEAAEGEDAPLTDEEVVEISERVFESAAVRRIGEERMSGFELRAVRDLLNTALFYLREAGNPAGVVRGPAVVAVEPAFAHSYAIYLRNLAAGDEGEETSERVMDVLGRFKGHVPHWVQAWLVEPLLMPGATLSAEAEEWLRRFLRDSGPTVCRVRAAVGLAAHKKLSPSEIAALVDDFPAVAVPDLVAALAISGADEDDPQAKSVRESEHLYKWIFEFAGRQDDCSWA